MRRELCFAAAAHVLVTLASPVAAQTIQNLGVLSGSERSYATGLSADGTVVVGYNTRPPQANPYVPSAAAFRWTAATGMVDLGGGLLHEWRAWGVSPDGATVVSSATPVFPDRPAGAGRWTAATAMGFLGAGRQSRATAASNTGVVVGEWYQPALGSPGQAFRWTQGAGVVALPGLLPGGVSGAAGIDAAGTLIAGSSQIEGGSTRACIWTDQGVEDLGVLPGSGHTTSRALAVSGNGAVVVGQSDTTGFRWTREGGMVPLGATAGVPTAVNQDGSIVLGVGAGGLYLWQLDSGPVNLHSYFTSLGVDLDGWSLTSATGVSADGTVFTGSGTYGGMDRAWLVVIPAPSGAAVLALACVVACRRKRR